MAFNKLQAKAVVKDLEKKHPGFFRLASYVALDDGDRDKLTHFSHGLVGIEHYNLQSVHDAFRRRFPHGRYGIVIACGDDVPASPPDDQPIMQRWAKIRGNFRPKIEAEILFLDTQWLDKAFEYQKRLTH